MSKRAFDIALAVAGLLVTSPLLAILAIVVKCSSPGPVLYRGVRIGRHGRPFTILKFRTMIADAERVGGTSTSDDDPRVTWVGRWMRSHKLDELPQLFNVLGGSMSLVGPRPQVAWAVDRYTTHERALLSVRPGLTDYASIHFSNEGELLRGAVDADTLYLELIAPTKIRLGLEYVQRLSWFEDLRILLATVVVALGRRPPAILVDVDRLLAGHTAAGSASETPRMESRFTPRP
jgi:lipopolysaccharide/colanic/teichoic acid biosynthesis glycosyltransferase